ncbi:host specificity factor TipJ family phage tail protein [Pelagibacterium montanilacus]|uniref:host specificity factor TipJ family phage tail protein n=1 Tax=Pelagibacterium montanilacus TaxID=2185280 RepID=UPI000F8C3D4A|nr:host specificity factor TipJ family phage tail protein [Pelagibacterium montanilacus]
MTSNLPVSCSGGRVLLMTGPFGTPDREIALDRPMAIGEVIKRFGLAFRLPTIAVLDGEPVLRGQWAVRRVCAGQAMAFVAVPGGGGGSGGGKQVLGLVAAVALAVAAPMIGGFVATNFFAGSAIASSLVTGLVLAGGSLLLNALFPPPAELDAGAPDAVYSVRAASNRATPFEAVPVLYGRLDFAPRFASRPYSEFEGNDQYLYQLFAVTLGKADVMRVRIGETEAWTAAGGYSASFSDLEIEIVQPGDDVSLFPANVVTAAEVAGQTVPDPPEMLGPFVVNPAGTEIDKIAIDFAFPAGLFRFTSEGKIARQSVSLRAEYRAIDDAGTPVGIWTDVLEETVSRSTRTPQRISRSVAVPAGRYEVRLLATAPFSSSDRVSDSVQWVGLRGYLTGYVTPPGCTLLAIKIRANEQLSQASASQVRVTAERWLDVWDPDAGDWALQKTRSIAWAAADLLGNSDYSVGLGADQFDLAELVRLDAVWAARGDSFNAIFDRDWTLSDALRAVLKAGRAQPVRLGGRIGFTRLEPRQIKRAVFTPRNVVRGSFTHELVLFDEDKPDHVVAEYIDEAVWDTREVRASLSAIGAEQPARLRYFGITDHDQAWREAVTDAAINAYQREIVGFTAEWEGKLLVRGDPILVDHPFIEAVETMGLVGRAGDALTLDRDLGAGMGDGDFHVIVRGRDGREWGPCRVQGMEERTLELDPSDRATVEGQMGALGAILPGIRSERAHVIVCMGETRPFNGLVVSARPNGPDRVDVVAVIDAPEVYAADATEPMPAPWTPPALPPVIPTRPSMVGLTAALHPGDPGLVLDCAWQPSSGASAYLAEVSYDDGDSWVPVYAGSANRFSAPVLPQVLIVRVAAVGVLQGPWVTREFVEGQLPNMFLPPEWVHDLGIPALGQELRNAHGLVTARDAGSLQAQLAELKAMGQQLALAVMDLDATTKGKIEIIDVHAGSASAAVVNLQKVVIEQGAAFAQQISEVAASIGDNLGNGYFSLTAAVDEEESSAVVSAGARAVRDGEVSPAAWRLRASINETGEIVSAFEVLADSFYLFSGEGEEVVSPFSFVDGVIRVNALIEGEQMVIDPFTGFFSFGASSS